MRISNTYFPLLGLVLSCSASAATFAEYQQIQQQSPNQVQIIDCRDSNFYNGWPQNTMKSGGHVPGAISLDANWLNQTSPHALSNLVMSKSISNKKQTFLYCGEKKAQSLAHALKSQGINNIKIITQPIDQYHGKLSALPQFQHLVPAWWLNDLIKGKDPLYTPKNGYKVVEVAWGPPAKYLLAHIPGAYYLNTNDIESEPWWNRVSPKQLKQVINDLGLRYDTTVILYGRDNTAAARAANILMYAGVKDVRLLNGGWQSWVDAGYCSEPMLNENHDKVDFGKPIPANPNYIIDVPQAKALLKQPKDQQSLVSIRSWAEYTGETSGYSYIKPKGRIPGSKWGHAGSDPYHLEDLRNPDGTMRSPNEIAQLWQQWDIKPNQDVAFYCGTGWRASEAFFDAYLMGWKNISVFDGGWYQWSGDKSNPTAHGDIKPPKQ